GAELGLRLLREAPAPAAPRPRRPPRRALALRHRRDLAPRHVAPLPLLVLRKLVEAQDAGVFAPVFALLRNGFRAHRRDLNRSHRPSRRDLFWLASQATPKLAG